MLLSVVAMKDGRVHSYALEQSEEQTPTGIWSFATQRWDMLTGIVNGIVYTRIDLYQLTCTCSVMLGAIILFVINEIRNHPPI
jgi:hypothetical protein